MLLTWCLDFLLRTICDHNFWRQSDRLYANLRRPQDQSYIFIIMYVHVNRSYQSRTGSVPDGSYQIHEACLIAALEQSSIQRSDKLNLLSNHCTYASKVIGFSSRFGMRSKSRSSSSFLIGILNLNTRFVVSCAISSWLQACASKAHLRFQPTAARQTRVSLTCLS